ncbi:hypothetical protein LR48_Vigan304s003500 [Vigna angularis]|uniref:Uncharacterized protein n=1 Tax=Phaseolus angularis TaxID=3914 RepID=A0A0L9T7Y4_PHAAN|nr:hypothetical protein LR48_Vigan304s003500 [Vigna angularis]
MRKRGEASNVVVILDAGLEEVLAMVGFHSGLALRQCEEDVGCHGGRWRLKMVATQMVREDEHDCCVVWDSRWWRSGATRLIVGGGRFGVRWCGEEEKSVCFWVYCGGPVAERKGSRRGWSNLRHGGGTTVTTAIDDEGDDGSREEDFYCPVTGQHG